MPVRIAKNLCVVFVRSARADYAGRRDSINMCLILCQVVCFVYACVFMCVQTCVCMNMYIMIYVVLKQFSG